MPPRYLNLISGTLWVCGGSNLQASEVTLYSGISVHWCCSFLNSNKKYQEQTEHFSWLGTAFLQNWLKKTVSVYLMNFLWHKLNQERIELELKGQSQHVSLDLTAMSAATHTTWVTTLQYQNTHLFIGNLKRVASVSLNMENNKFEWLQIWL